jgi:hypothetical protein
MEKGRFGGCIGDDTMISPTTNPIVLVTNNPISVPVILIEKSGGRGDEPHENARCLIYEESLILLKQFAHGSHISACST